MRSKSRGFFADLHKPAALRLFLHIMICCGLLEVLRDDNRAVVRAASQASKAADYILGFLPEDERLVPAAADIDEREAA